MLVIRLLTPSFPLAAALGTPLSWIVAAAIYLICSAGYAGLFAKAGIAPVKAFVPVLNVYTAFQMSGAGVLLFGAYAVSLAAGIALAQVERIAMALTVFFYAYQCFRMVSACGKDLPAAAALLLAEPVYAAFLGFGPAAYDGPFGPAVYDGPAKPKNPLQPFNVDNILGEDSPFDEDMNLKDEYMDELGRK